MLLIFYNTQYLQVPKTILTILEKLKKKNKIKVVWFEIAIKKIENDIQKRFKNRQCSKNKI